MSDGNEWGKKKMNKKSNINECNETGCKKKILETDANLLLKAAFSCFDACLWWWKQVWMYIQHIVSFAFKTVSEEIKDYSFYELLWGFLR